MRAKQKDLRSVTACNQLSQHSLYYLPTGNGGATQTGSSRGAIKLPSDSLELKTKTNNPLNTSIYCCAC